MTATKQMSREQHFGPLSYCDWPYMALIVGAKGIEPVASTVIRECNEMQSPTLQRPPKDSKKRRVQNKAQGQNEHDTRIPGGPILGL